MVTCNIRMYVQSLW